MKINDKPLPILERHVVPIDAARARLSDYACGVFELLPSRKSVKKAIKRGAIYVNKQLGQTGTWIEGGESIEFVEIERPVHKVYWMDLEVLYEDEQMAVIHKPSGINTNGNQFRTIENALPHNLEDSSESDTLARMRPVHRLDNLTSGVLLIAKTLRARIELGRQFEAKEIEKQYAAIVIGEIPIAGVITDSIDGKTATTRYQRVRLVPSLRNEKLSLVHLFPETGRTHQLRIHLSTLGFPILGDPLYGHEGMILRKKGLFLCALQVTFQHPTRLNKQTAQLALPNKFNSLLERELKRWTAYHPLDVS